MYLFLPGNNKGNKEWCESLKDVFEGNNQMIYYDHWKGEGNINWDTELEKIKDLNIKEKVNVVGKSAGCVLGMKAHTLGYIDVNKYIFIGFPYYWTKQRGDNVDELLDNLKTDSLFIQKPHDPVIGYEELNTILRSKHLNVSTLRYERVTEPSNNHDYEDIQYLYKVISDFVNS